MAQKSGFFNALYQNGVYDRKYNANDYSDNLAVVISNGVLRSDADDLKVTATGMYCTVSAGRAWINGHYYYNDAPYSFSAVSAPTGGSRYDRIMLRLNTDVSERSIELRYVQGTAGNTPTKPAPVRNRNIYDLVLADIYVGTNATSVVVTDTRADADVCGWVYSTSGDNSFFASLDDTFYDWFSETKDTLSSVTLFKRYIWRSVLQSPSKTVVFNIPQYNADTCFLEVFVNGILDAQGVNYTVSGTILTFANTLVAGTEIIVNVYKSIDGTGIMSVADEITELQNQVATLTAVSDFTYKAVNSNDNITLSQIAQAFYSGSYTAADVTPQAAAFLENLGGNTYLSALPTDAHITINVVGTLGISTPFAGSGTSTSRYKWFSLGVDAVSDKRITFDFANAERLLIWCTTNTENIIFYGTDMDIRNLHIQAKCNAAGCAIEMFAGRYNYGNINVENSKVYIATTGQAMISKNGTFTNCNFYCSSSNTHSLMFCPADDSLIQIIGGTYKAYTAAAASDVISAIFYTYSTTPNAVVMAYNINCPTIAVSNFYQKKLAVAYSGKTYINGIITTLSSEGNFYEIVGAVAKDKSR